MVDGEFPVGENFLLVHNVESGMLPLANVIFPAFFAPYVMQILVPVAGLAGLAAEVIFYHWWTGEARIGRLLAMVLVANVVSSAVGMIIAGQLHAGYKPATQTNLNPSWRGAEWIDYVALAWVLAFVISVAIEWPIVVLFRKFVIIRRAFTASLFANACSYVVLLAMLFLYAISH